MSVEASGFSSLSVRDASGVERGAVMGSLAAGLGFAAASAIGARPLASAVAGGAVGLMASQIASREAAITSGVAKVGEINWSSIKVSLNLTEAVIVPMVGGAALTFSSDPKLRRDGVGLLAVAAVGTALGYLAIRS